MNSKTYKLSDGTYEWVGYGQNVHYADQNGIFLEIDDTIINEDIVREGTNFKYRNKANAYAAMFADYGSGTLPVRLEYKGKYISFGASGAESAVGVKVNRFDSEILQNTVNPKDCVMYPNVYPGIDILYEARSDRLKEFIIINQRTDINEFSFDIKTDGLKPTQNGGVIEFSDQNTGEAIFHIGGLFAIDAAGNETPNVMCSIINENGSYHIVVTVDREYLSDPERIYPVIIDPSVIVSGASKTFDSYMSSRYPDSNYYTSYYLRTGRSSTYYIGRTYMNFTLPTNIPSGYVTSAYLRLLKCGGVAPSVKAYRVLSNWNSSSITWNNKPGYTSTEASGTAYNDSGSWYRMYVTAILKKWLNGTYGKYGLMIRDATESGTTQYTWFYSSDALAANNPQLHIYFTAYGSRPYEDCDSTGINCAGYALNYDAYLTMYVLGMTDSGIDNCNTTSELLSYVQNSTDTWMNSHISYNTLYAHYSYINEGQYRAVLRVGWRDTNGDGELDYNEEWEDPWDYHWWYQTDTGQWAEKMGPLPSELIDGTDADTNPYSIDWPNFGYPDFYNSFLKCYAINS